VALVVIGQLPSSRGADVPAADIAWIVHPRRLIINVVKNTLLDQKNRHIALFMQI
jgi:hypothetical protein